MIIDRNTVIMIEIELEILLYTPLMKWLTVQKVGLIHQSVLTRKKRGNRKEGDLAVRDHHLSVLTNPRLFLLSISQMWSTLYVMNCWVYFFYLTSIFFAGGMLVLVFGEIGKKGIWQCVIIICPCWQIGCNTQRTPREYSENTERTPKNTQTQRKPRAHLDNTQSTLREHLENAQSVTREWHHRVTLNHSEITQRTC